MLFEFVQKVTKLKGNQVNQANYKFWLKIYGREHDALINTRVIVLLIEEKDDSLYIFVIFYFKLIKDKVCWIFSIKRQIKIHALKKLKIQLSQEWHFILEDLSNRRTKCELLVNTNGCLQVIYTPVWVPQHQFLRTSL